MPKGTPSLVRPIAFKSRQRQVFHIPPRSSEVVSDASNGFGIYKFRSQAFICQDYTGTKAMLSMEPLRSLDEFQVVREVVYLP
jgi:hypothetical protein